MGDINIEDMGSSFEALIDKINHLYIKGAGSNKFHSGIEYVQNAVETKSMKLLSSLLPQTLLKYLPCARH